MTDREYILMHWQDCKESIILALEERIAIMIYDSGVSEEKAREWALFGKF